MYKIMTMACLWGGECAQQMKIVFWVLTTPDQAFMMIWWSSFDNDKNDNIIFEIRCLRCWWTAGAPASKYFKEEEAAAAQRFHSNWTRNGNMRPDLLNLDNWWEFIQVLKLGGLEDNMTDVLNLNQPLCSLSQVSVDRLECLTLPMTMRQIFRCD